MMEDLTRYALESVNSQLTTQRRINSELADVLKAMTERMDEMSKRIDLLRQQLNSEVGV